MGDVKDNIVGGITSLGDRLGNGLTSLGGDIKAVFYAINNLPSNIISLLKTTLEELFIPNTTPIDNIKSKFDTKLPVINQIGEIAFNLFNDFRDVDTVPTFTITMNGHSYNIINLEWYRDYRLLVKGILTCLAWLYFVQWLLRFIPRLLGGVT